MLVTLGRGISPAQIKNSQDSLMIEEHIPSCVFDMDATLAQSYNGGGDWKNLVHMPADGALQSDYDLQMRGTLSLSGEAGQKDSYLLCTGDGGFRFNHTPFTNILQRTDKGAQAYSCVFAFKFIQTSGAQGLAATSGNNISAGFVFNILANNRLNFRQNMGSSGVAALIDAEHMLVDGKDYIIGFSKQSAGDKFTFWVQGVSLPVANESLPCTQDAETTTMGLFASSSGTGWPMPAGARLYAASFYNSYLTQTQMNEIMAIYRKRHNRAYG